MLLLYNRGTIFESIARSQDYLQFLRLLYQKEFKCIVFYINQLYFNNYETLNLFWKNYIHNLKSNQLKQVRVNGFGIFIMFIFPGAYVDLCSDHLKIISPIRQLRIFCAGVWHNIVIVIIAVSCIQIHPHFLNTFFAKNAYVNNINRVIT